MVAKRSSRIRYVKFKAPDLLSLMQSPEVRSAFAIASRRAVEKYQKSVFSVYNSIDSNDCSLSPVIQAPDEDYNEYDARLAPSSKDSAAIGDEEKKQGLLRLSTNFSKLDTPPYTEGSLDILFERGPMDKPPLVARGYASSETMGQILLLQRGKFSQENLRENVRYGIWLQLTENIESVADDWNDPEVASRIAIPGIVKAEILNYSMTPQDKSKVIYENPKVLNTFC